MVHHRDHLKLFFLAIFAKTDFFSRPVSVWTVSLKLSKNWTVSLKLFKNTTLNLYFQKYRDYKAWNSVSNCNEKNVITFENLHGCKKTKKTVSKHEKLWQFWKNGNTFLIFRFFFANVKKKSKFWAKKKKQKLCNNFNSIFSKIH